MIFFLKIKKLGRRTLHCEILEKSYNSDLIQVYKPTELGNRFFKIRTTYFAKEQVIKRTKSTFGRKLLAEKGKKLYMVIYGHINEHNTPITRQELFNHYNLGKYDIDIFKHNLIELGLIKRVPLPLKSRYSQD